MLGGWLKRHLPHAEEENSPGYVSLASGEDADGRYPVPAAPPRYDAHPTKAKSRKGLPLYEFLTAVFVGVALVESVWFAYVLLSQGRPGEKWWIVHLVLFWAMVAYLALPRLHQVVSLIYVPDYFIGRTRTGDGILGDPINLAFDGTEGDVHAAMRAAGWVKADPITLRSSWRMIVSALLRRSYPAAPVSALYLFKRSQDFSYQQEVSGNVAQRHHVRLWQAPEGWHLPGGERVGWLAAGTYDRSVGLSLFTGQVTHKIDANIDAERDYIVDTIRFSDPRCGVRVIDKFSSSYHSRNGGGDAVVTDGDLPVVDVSGAAVRAIQGDAVTPEELVPERKAKSWMTADHAVPPLPLILGVLMILASGVIVGAQAYLDSHTSTAAVVVTNVCVLLLAGLTLARSSSAWLALMAVEAASTLYRLLFYTSGRNLVVTALAVLVVLAVSAPSVRDWVARGRIEPEIPITRSALSEYVARRIETVSDAGALR